ncbi:hypothetical protein NEUTE2DRAFT_123683 [Neurospora tetrasperma FGSC 2509]|nr:hypothetical protein NEUTE2DRAFT_123683 [Neurospora tetrasperma FGSC 2509]
MTFAELQRLNVDLCPGSIVWLWVLSAESGSIGLWHVVSFHTSKSGACHRVDDGNLTWPRRPYYGSRLEFAPARSRTVVLSDVQYQDQECWHPIPEPHQHHEASNKRGSANNAKNPTPLILRASPTAPMPASRISCKFPESYRALTGHSSIFN